MDTETYFFGKKYSKFTENMKNSLKKAIQRGNIKLANCIQEYLDTIIEIKKVYKLKATNDVKVYRDDIKIYENKLEDLQLKIIDIQFNKTDIYNKDKIVIDIPKYVNNDLNYIFMFIYKFIEINSEVLCILFKNIVNDLFNIDILEEEVLIKNTKTTTKTTTQQAPTVVQSKATTQQAPTVALQSKTTTISTNSSTS